MEYVALVVALLKRSNFTFWPEAGGFNDQDMDLVEDVMVYLALERRAEWDKEHGTDMVQDYDGPIPTESFE